MTDTTFQMWKKIEGEFPKKDRLRVKREFHRTGSRYMACAYPPSYFGQVRESDWDFVTDYMLLDEINEWLSDGWVELDNQSYLDRNTSIVLEKVIFGEKVQVSMKNDVHLYLEAVDDLDAEEYFKVRTDKKALAELMKKQYMALGATWMFDDPFRGIEVFRGKDTFQ